MQHTIDQEFVDSRTGDIATIVDIVSKPTGSLYTVQYGDDKYRKYYDYKFNKFFIPVSMETYSNITEDISYHNVTFLDFKNRAKFADISSWLQWLGF